MKVSRMKNIEKARATLAVNTFVNYCYNLDTKLYGFSRRLDNETIDKICEVCGITQNDILFLYPAEVMKFVFRTDLNEDETRLILIEHFRENSYDYFA
jgi:hypothetical protein